MKAQPSGDLLHPAEAEGKESCITDARPRVPGCVCDLRLPCGVHLREQRAEEARRVEYVAPRRYRNTEGLRGHANARKRARN